MLGLSAMPDPVLRQARSFEEDFVRRGRLEHFFSRKAWHGESEIDHFLKKQAKKMDVCSDG